MDDATLDIEQHDQLLRYLRATGRIADDESPRFATLAGGVSNRTVLVERASGESWVLKQALAKLRVKVDWFSDPSRIHREALGLKWLEKLAPPGTITPLIFEDERHHLLAMQAVPQPHENWKTMLMSGRVRINDLATFGQLLSTIHTNAARSPEPLHELFADRSFFESLRVEPYYLFTADQVPEARGFLHALVNETRRRRFTLVHGDYSPKNVLVSTSPDRFVLLDHEVIHWGDPLFDVGFAATHLMSKAHHAWHRASRPGAHGAHGAPVKNGAAYVFWRWYDGTLDPGAAWRERLDEFAVRHTLACLLARVAGRSLLEYFDDVERARQRRVVVDLMRAPPTRMRDLIQEFARRIARDAGD
jgi:hypothetical protein